MKPRTRDARFILERIAPDPDSHCWNWTGSISVHGRAVYNATYAYRISHEIFIGPLNGLQVNHHCDNPRCVNPEHLYAGTQRQNMDDAVARGRLLPPPPRRGEAHYLGHPDAVVAEVRRAIGSGELTKRQAAERYNIDITTVRQWLRGSRAGMGRVKARDERLKPPAPCGTRAGYCRHKKAGDPRCDPCWAANLDYMRAYKARRRELRSAA